MNKKGKLLEMIITLTSVIIGIIIVTSVGGDILDWAKSLRTGGKNIAGEYPCNCGSLRFDELIRINHEEINYCIHSRTECTINLDKNLYKTIMYERQEGTEPIPLCVYTPSDCETQLLR